MVRIRRGDERTGTDAVMLRYEVTPDSNQLRFRYVLASEEHGDSGYVTPGFDDTAIISVGEQRCGLPGDTALLVEGDVSVNLVDLLDELRSLIDGLTQCDEPHGEDRPHQRREMSISDVSDATSAITQGASVSPLLSVPGAGDSGVVRVIFGDEAGRAAVHDQLPPDTWGDPVRTKQTGGHGVVVEHVGGADVFAAGGQFVMRHRLIVTHTDADH